MGRTTTWRAVHWSTLGSLGSRAEGGDGIPRPRIRETTQEVGMSAERCGEGRKPRKWYPQPYSWSHRPSWCPQSSSNRRPLPGPRFLASSTCTSYCCLKPLTTRLPLLSPPPSVLLSLFPSLLSPSAQPPSFTPSSLHDFSPLPSLRRQCLCLSSVGLIPLCLAFRLSESDGLLGPAAAQDDSGICWSSSPWLQHGLQSASGQLPLTSR